MRDAGLMAAVLKRVLQKQHRVADTAMAVMVAGVNVETHEITL
jgi:hypothetical protein